MVFNLKSSLENKEVKKQLIDIFKISSEDFGPGMSLPRNLEVVLFFDGEKIASDQISVRRLS